MKKLNKILILLFLTLNVYRLKFVSCFDVKFRAVYDAEVEPFNTQIYKREMAQFFDKASYSFNGFKKVESIPVLFPIDICVLNLEGIKYAASLYKKPDGQRHFAVHKMNNGTYELIAERPTPLATAMDCRGLGDKGYIAMAYNFSKPIENAREGSPIYELRGDHLRAIQYFAMANLVNVYLRVRGNDLMLLQTFKNTKSTPNLNCPYYQLSGSTFNRVGRIPCSNAKHLEPFSIDYEDYVAVANYADQRGRTSTYSEIYKFMREKKKFQLFQKIKTHGAVDVRYFNVPVDEARRQHFLIFGNSLSATNRANSDEVKTKNFEADSIVYVFDKGQFVPYQRLNFYAVKQFLPIQNADAEKFLLLVSSTNQDIKIYNLNDWKFEESSTQFTEGALSKGVARMRIFQDQEESFLVIANEKMMDNETNIFLPIYKQEEHANALRQQIIDWTKENMERLKRVDIEKLKRNVEQKLQSPQQFLSEHLTDIPQAYIENVETKTLTNPHLHMDSNYWEALRYAHLALTVLEKQHTSPHQIHKREASPPDFYEFENVKVNKLLVRTKLEAQNVNGIESKSPSFEQIKAKEVIVTGKYFEPALKTSDFNETSHAESFLDLNVGNLTLNGKIHGLHWQELLNDTLKCKGQQFIKSVASFENFSTKAMTVTDGKINNMNLAKLVQTNHGNFVVSQQIQFDAPVIAKDVIINERLNQIQVFQRKLDVLLKRSNKTQVITGPKRLNNVRLLQPISMAGSTSGNHLRAVSPSKAVHKDLVLHGDFIIDGDVTISKLLSTTDLWHAKTNTSAKMCLTNGLHIDLPLENVNLNFAATAQANNSIVSFINTEDMQELLKANTKDRQIIQGFKTFKHNLIINNGLNEVKIINGIDTESIKDELLLSNTNQTIRSPMHIGRILAKGFQAPKLTMNNQPKTEFLTKSGKQHINGDLKIDKLKVDNILAQNLNTNGKIFDRPLADIYQKNKKQPLHKSKIFQINPKSIGTIYVKNLYINGSLNGKPAADLEQQLQQLDGNIKYVGNYNFNYETSIKNLTFAGQLNGISASDFGSCWLQKSGYQTFTAPQTFASVQFNKATLDGKLNGYNLRDFDEQTYWIDRDEYIVDATFQNPTEMQQPLNTKTLNHLYVPQDILYRNANQPQILSTACVLAKHLQVAGSIKNITKLYHIDLQRLEEYLHSSTTLFVKDANLTFAPKYKTLNKIALEQLLDKIWLANENVELPDHVEISEGYFEGLLDLEGPVNNMNLLYLQENYLSRSKQQTISNEAVFLKDVVFSSKLQTNEVSLSTLTETESQQTINFDEFVSNTLKTSGNHEIRNKWTLLNATVAGALQDVTVNNLNLATDVVRCDTKNVIAGEKQIPSSATIQNLMATVQSTVNDVEMANWLNSAVYTNRNQTIYGITTLENANLADLYIEGRLNNMKFDKNKLWLRNISQQVPGRTTIYNRLEVPQQRIFVNNIKNLHVDFVNGKNMNEFLENIATVENGPQTPFVDGNLIFEKPLVVDEYVSSDTEVTGKKWKRQIMDAANDWLKLEKAVKILHNAFRERKVLKEFQLKQILPISATKLIHMPIFLDGEVLNLIALSNKSNDAYTIIFRWNTDCDCFTPYNEGTAWLPKDAIVLDIFQMLFETTDYLTISRPGHDFLSENTTTVSSDGFMELLHLKNENSQYSMTPFKLNSKNCFMVLDGKGVVNAKIYCLNAEEENPLLKFHLEAELETNVTQMVMLTDQLIALLIVDTIEIWNTTELKFHARLPLKKAKQMATCFVDGVSYLAIVTVGNSKTAEMESLKIYRFSVNGEFQHQQTLNLDAPVNQIEFLSLSESRDLLLFARTSIKDKALLIYQLQGVKGLVPIFSGISSNVLNKMQLLHLKTNEKHFVVLFGDKSLLVVEIVLKSF